MFNEMSFFNGVPEALPEVVAKLDRWGGPETFPHYAIGWAVAGNTPFAYAKQVAADFGGTADGMVIRWPKGIAARGEVRTQFHHVIDIAPTVLDVAGLPEPKSVNFSLAHDLAAKHPEKLAELKALFLQEAVKYSVLPIDDRSIERLDPAVAGRPVAGSAVDGGLLSRCAGDPSRLWAASSV